MADVSIKKQQKEKT